MKPRLPYLESLLGAVPRTPSKPPQGPQVPLLPLSQAPNPSDIDSFVGAVASQRTQRLAPLEVPQRDGPIIPATGQQAPIGTAPERPDRPLMRLAQPHALPTLHIPPAQHAVTAATDQQLPARIPGHRIDNSGMSLKGAITWMTSPPERVAGRVALSALHLPHEQLSAASAAATSGQSPPVGAPGHARDDPLMTCQPLEQRAIGGVPHIHVAIITTADQASAVGAPGHVTDPSRQLTPDPPVGARRHLPHLHAMQIGSAGQPVPIRIPGHTKEDGVGIVGVLVPLDTGPGGRIPQGDDIVPRATGQRASIRTPSHPKHGPAMSTQHPGWRLTSYIPDGDQCIGAATDQLRAIRTPVEVEEGGCVALHNAHALPTGHIPHTQGAIFTATEQAATVGREGQTVYPGGMSVQHCPRSALYDIP